MTRGRHGRRAAPLSWLRQVVAGLVALPLSALPFVAYANLTPEGRLLRDRALVALRPPALPTLGPRAAAAAVAAAPRYRGHVMALAYHGIGSASDGDGGFVVSPGRFGEHLATLRAAGMRTVTAAQVASAFQRGRPLPTNAVMISFDDGRTDAMMFADPLLAEARMAATMFVITGAAEKPGIYYASWDKLEGYARSGRWDLQSHTATLHHDQKAKGGGELPALTSLSPGESLAAYRARVRADLASASAAIERHVGRPPVAFAYPFGAYGAERTNDPGIRKVLRAEVTRRYALAFHQDDQGTVPLAGSGDDRLGLRRLEVGDWSGLDLLRRIRQAAGRTPGWASDRQPEPDPSPADQGSGSVDEPGEPATAPSTTVPAAVNSPPGPPSRGPGAPRLPSPRVTPPPAPVPLTGTTSPPTVGPTTTAAPPTPPPPPVTTTPPSPATTTTPPPTTTTTAPPPTTTTTTTVPPTTVPRGCRSHGSGNVCPPKGGG